MAIIKRGLRKKIVLSLFKRLWFNFLLNTFMLCVVMSPKEKGKEISMLVQQSIFFNTDLSVIAQWNKLLKDMKS